MIKGFKVSNMHDILDEITEIRTRCGFREKVKQESTMPHRRSRFKLAWLMYSWTLCSRMHVYMHIFETLKTEQT